MFRKKMVGAVLLACLLISAQVFGQVPSEVKKTFVGGTLAQAGENLNIGFLGGVPLDTINGHVAILGLKAIAVGPIPAGI